MFSWPQLPKPIVALSPMADMTDGPFCTIVRSVSTAYQPVIFREMVASEAIVRGNEKTLSMAAFDPLERPIIQQIFGSDPKAMARAATTIEKRFHPDGIDINMGCPVYKLTSNFNGAALMKDAPKAAAIVTAIKRAVATPVSVKIRLGWSDPKEGREFAQWLEGAGADCITVHGRTKMQGYAGSSHWREIGEIKKRVSIPVLANGDIHNAQSAQRALEESDADGVMIGRGALGNPWVFQEIAYALNRHDDNAATTPSLSKKISIILQHAELMLDRYGSAGIILFRKHIPWYLKGLPNVKNTRMALVRSSTLEEVEQHLRAYAGALYPHRSKACLALLSSPVR